MSDDVTFHDIAYIYTSVEQIYPLADLEVRSSGVIEGFEVRE